MSLNTILLFSLACLALGQTQYTVAIEYDDCTNKDVFAFAVSIQDTSDCVSSSCACVGGRCGEFRCNQTGDNVPNYLSNAIILRNFDSNDCSGPVSFATATKSGHCISTPGFANVSATSSMQTCGANFHFQTFDVADCAGDPSSDITAPNPGTICTATGGSSSSEYSCTNPACIHVDTKFTYKGIKHDFESIPEECTIPHVVTRDGVKITTSCVGELRLTHEHLVMTPEGWKEAGSMKVGDSLYSKIGGEELCTVASVGTERGQKYSGLNCIESEIEANGYWISTFGSVHQVPAIWMKYASKVVGVQTASSVGDYFANLFSGYY